MEGPPSFHGTGISVTGRMKETSMSSERKVAVITGASQGIGAALVEAYRDRDYGVVATARSIRPTNDDQILVVPGDITDRKTAERAISEGLARFGRIDTLINNAGVFVAKPFTQYTEADYAAVLGVNLTGFFHITQLAIVEMEKRHSGPVVQITTSLIEHANSHVRSVLASLTKGGLSAATKSLAIEYAKLGIRVNAVAPGVIKTQMHPVETHAQLAKLHPLGRMGEISDIVGAILYLESAGFDGRDHSCRWRPECRPLNLPSREPLRAAFMRRRGGQRSEIHVAPLLRPRFRLPARRSAPRPHGFVCLP
jgi:NAD(P)-dependent dehydrogenase (short-subunit alcohol dehydrogenase family)